MDALFAALRNRHRRQILAALMTESARWKDEFETRAVRPADTARVETAIDLRHRHLPQLAEAGFIEWDRTTDQVRRGEDFHEIRPILELIDEVQEQLSDNGP